jgi:hypothetical protein
MSQAELDPSHIMQVGMGFWPSKVVLSAVELELFTELGADAMSGAEIGDRLGLHARGIYDFLDTLVALRSSSVTATGPMVAIATPTSPRRSWTSEARPTSAESSRCPTPGCMASGATSPRR